MENPSNWRIAPKLPSRDLEATRIYYEQWGFAVLGYYPDYLLLQGHGSELHFYLYPAHDPKASDHMLYVRVDDVEKWHKLAQQIGPVRDLERKPWGQTEFSVLDPDGTLLTFA
jgi:catechol 2,3-dioxygenase-like lactoylglutathione lyase family enzyme